MASRAAAPPLHEGGARTELKPQVCASGCHLHPALLAPPGNQAAQAFLKGHWLEAELVSGSADFRSRRGTGFTLRGQELGLEVVRSLDPLESLP